MPPNTLDFTTDPLHFMRIHPVRPEPSRGTISDADLSVEDVSVVESAMRLQFSDHPAFGANTYKLDHFMTGSPLPVYYLPWTPRRITKLIFPPITSRRFFFTSAIGGCSIFVAGTPARPVVYHAGIDGVVDNALAAVPGLTPAVQHAATIKDAPQFWRKLIKMREPHINIIAEVNRADYVFDGTFVNPPGVKGYFATPSIKSTVTAKTFGNALWWKRIIGAEVIPWGTFWGMKQKPPSKRWNFYLQENALVKKNNNTMIGVVMQLTRIDPNRAILFTHDANGV